MKGFVKVQNGKLYYEIQGDGFPIVLIHGFGLDNRMWHEQVEFLKVKFKVITYDMRGFGQSSLPNQKYSHHEDLFELLKHLNISKCNLVGLSLGGEKAIDFILTYPNMVKSLVLISSSLGGYKSTVNWTVYDETAGLEEAKINWLKHAVFEKSNQNLEVKVRLTQIVKDYSGWHWTHKSDYNFINPPALNRLSEIKQKTLIIAGEEDLTYFKHIARLLHDGIKNSELKFIYDCGHMVNMEKVDKLNSLIENNFK